MNIPIELIVIVAATALAWVVSQLFKLLWLPKPSFVKVFSTSGGMPSAHTATLVTFVVTLFFYEGFTSVVALSALLAVIVIKDSMGVRLATGINASVLKSSLSKNKKLQKKVMVERGHTLEHVLVGAAIGLIISFSTYLLFLA